VWGTPYSVLRTDCSKAFFTGDVTLAFTVRNLLAPEEDHGLLLASVHESGRLLTPLSEQTSLKSGINTESVDTNIATPQIAHRFHCAHLQRTEYYSTIFCGHALSNTLSKLHKYNNTAKYQVGFSSY